jgi:hypothetical protein
MLVARKIIVKINKLAQLVRTLKMKDVRATKKILGIHRDEENGKRRILMRFSMNLVRLVNVSLAFFVIFLQVCVIVIRKTEDMSHV